MKPLAEKGDKRKQELKELSITQYYYSDKVDFVQVVTLKKAVKTSISGTITYMACTDEMCLPVEELPFSITIP